MLLLLSPEATGQSADISNAPHSSLDSPGPCAALYIEEEEEKAHTTSLLLLTPTLRATGQQASERSHESAGKQHRRERQRQRQRREQQYEYSESADVCGRRLAPRTDRRRMGHQGVAALPPCPAAALRRSEPGAEPGARAQRREAGHGERQRGAEQPAAGCARLGEREGSRGSSGSKRFATRVRLKCVFPGEARQRLGALLDPRRLPIAAVFRRPVRVLYPNNELCIRFYFHHRRRERIDIDWQCSDSGDDLERTERSTAAGHFCHT